jgi:Dpy-30 motif
MALKEMSSKMEKYLEHNLVSFLMDGLNETVQHVPEDPIDFLVRNINIGRVPVQAQFGGQVCGSPRVLQVIFDIIINLYVLAVCYSGRSTSDIRYNY